MRYDLEGSRAKMDAVFDLCRETGMERDHEFAFWEIVKMEEGTIALIYDLLVAQYAQGLSDGIQSVARDCYGRPI